MLISKVDSITLVLFICSSTVLSRPSTMIFQNNQYTNVVVAIHESIAEDKTHIDKLKATMTKASQTLYQATRQRAYFKEITILLPHTWSDDASYSAQTSESINLADVIITDNFRRKRSVHTRSYRGCGEQGVHVLLNKDFLTLPRAAPFYNSPEKYFVHAFAQFRWGVFQEYAEEGEQPFYISLNSGRPEAIRCVFNMRGLVQKNDANHTICYTDIDRDTGLYSDGCLWRPYPYRQPIKASMMDFQFINEIQTFCDDNATNRQTIHNYESPSKHNRLCEHRSVWEIIRDSPDFRGGLNSAISVTPAQLTPTFKVVRAVTRRRRAVVNIDQSSVIQLNRQSVFTHLGRLKREADRHSIPLTISVSNHDVIREHHINSFDDLRELSSDVLRPDFVVSTPKKESVTINTNISAILVGDPISNNTFQDVKHGYTSTQTFLDQFRYSLMTDLESLEAFSIIKKEELVINPDLVSRNTVHIDDSLTPNISFVFHYEQTKPSIVIYPPTKSSLTLLDAEVSEEVREVVVQCKAQKGKWTYTIKSNASQSISVIVTAKSNTLQNIDVRLTTERPDMMSPYFRIFVDVTQYHHPVVGLNVTATVQTPSGDLNLVHLLDNGAGSDLMKDDGVYSRFFLSVTEPGYYLVTATVFGEHGNVMRKEEYFHDEEFEILGSPKQSTRMAINGPIERHVGRHSIFFGPSDVRNITNDVIPPCRITDLSVSKHVLYKNTFILKFTAPGDNLDTGRAFYYEVYLGEEITSIQDFIAHTATPSFKGQGHITKTINRAFSVAMETDIITYRNDKVSRNRPVVFGVIGVDCAGNRARVSNIVTVKLHGG